MTCNVWYRTVRMLSMRIVAARSRWIAVDIVCTGVVMFMHTTMWRQGG